MMEKYLLLFGTIANAFNIVLCRAHTILTTIQARVRKKHAAEHSATRTHTHIFVCLAW